MDGLTLKIGAILITVVILIVMFVCYRKNTNKLESDIKNLKTSSDKTNEILQQFIAHNSGKDTGAKTGAETEIETETETETVAEEKISEKDRIYLTQTIQSSKRWTSKTEDKNYSLNIVYINYYGKIQNFSCDPNSINQSSPDAEWISVNVGKENIQINLKKQFIVNIKNVEAAFPRRLKKQIATQRKQFEKEKRDKENSITITYKSKSYEENRRFHMPKFNLHLSSIIKKRTSPDFISAITLDDPKREAKRLMFRIKKIESIVIHKDNTRLVKPKEIAQFLQKNAQQK